MIGRWARIDQLFDHEMAHDRGEEHSVGTGTDGEVEIGRFGRAGPTGIDHDDPTAPLPDGLDSARKVGCGTDAAVGRVGVGPEHHEQIGAVEIGHRHDRTTAVEVTRRHMAGHLINGAGRKDSAAADPLDDLTQMGGRREQVGIGVA